MANRNSIINHNTFFSSFLFFTGLRKAMKRFTASSIKFESRSPEHSSPHWPTPLMFPTQTLEYFSFVVLTVFPSSDLPRENKSSVETVTLILICHCFSQVVSSFFLQQWTINNIFVLSVHHGIWRAETSEWWNKATLYWKRRSNLHATYTI